MRITRRCTLIFLSAIVYPNRLNPIMQKAKNDRSVRRALPVYDHAVYTRSSCSRSLKPLRYPVFFYFDKSDKQSNLHMHRGLVSETKSYYAYRGARWLSGRVSDSGARGPGFETYRRRVVSLSKTLYSPKVLVNYPGSDGSVPT